MPIDTGTILGYAGTGLSLLLGLLLAMVRWTFTREISHLEKQSERLEARIERLKETQDTRAPVLASKVDRGELGQLARAQDVARLDAKLEGIETKLDQALLRLVKNE